MEERNYKLYLHITPSDKRYYGITGQEKVEYRWDNGKGYNTPHFRNAIKKYGWDNIQHEVIFDNLTKEEACLLEQCYIALYNTMNPKYGYNSTTGGEHCEVSEESKKKRSEASKKAWADPNSKLNSPEVRKKMGEAMMGNNSWAKMSEEAKLERSKNISEKMKGRKMSEETKEKLRKINTGKKMSEEQKKQISITKTGKLRDDESPHAKKVKCIELDIIFPCVTKANEYFGIDRNSDIISNCARKNSLLDTPKHKSRGYHWKYVEEGDVVC